jgi:hypothetical protein
MLLLDCDMIAGPTFLLETIGHFYERRDAAPAGGEPVGGGKKALWARKPKMAFLQVGFLGIQTGARLQFLRALSSCHHPTTNKPRPSTPLEQSNATPTPKQTPQDFYNLSPIDPLAHGGRLFYGPLQQGRDGAGAVCCCGTGVVWQRDVLVSCGGFAHDSITEDNLTSQKVAAAGFGGAYLNRRAIFGLAPDDIPGTFEQRARWCMGALQVCLGLGLLSVGSLATLTTSENQFEFVSVPQEQNMLPLTLPKSSDQPPTSNRCQILARRNPLAMAGLGFKQRLLYFDSCAYSLTAPATIMLMAVPVIFLFTHTSPFSIPRLWELCVAFGTYFVLMQASMWQAHRGAVGGRLEHWRGTQVAFWMSFMQVGSVGGWGLLVGVVITQLYKRPAADSGTSTKQPSPLQVKSLLTVIKSESNFLSWLFRARSLGFVVTQKGAKQDTRWTAVQKALPYVWPHLLYILAYLAGIILFIVHWSTGRFENVWQLLVTVVAVFWGALTVIYITPPLMPLVWPAAAAAAGGEDGWDIEWRAGSVVAPGVLGGWPGGPAGGGGGKDPAIAGIGGGRAASMAALQQLMTGIPSRQLQRNKDRQLQAIPSHESDSSGGGGGAAARGDTAAASITAGRRRSFGRRLTFGSFRAGSLLGADSTPLVPSWRDETARDRKSLDESSRTPTMRPAKAVPAAAVAVDVPPPAGASEVALVRAWAPGQLKAADRAMTLSADPDGRAVNYQGVAGVLSRVYALADEDHEELRELADKTASARHAGAAADPADKAAAAAERRAASPISGGAKVVIAEEPGAEAAAAVAGGEEPEAEAAAVAAAAAAGPPALQPSASASRRQLATRQLSRQISRQLSRVGSSLHSLRVSVLGSTGGAAFSKLARGRPVFDNHVHPPSTAGWMMFVVNAGIVAALVAAAVLEPQFAQGWNVAGPLDLLPRRP